MNAAAAAYPKVMVSVDRMQQMGNEMHYPHMFCGT